MKLSQMIKKQIEQPQKDIEKIKKANDLAKGNKELGNFIIKRI